MRGRSRSRPSACEGTAPRPCRGLLRSPSLASSRLHRPGVRLLSQSTNKRLGPSPPLRIFGNDSRDPWSGREGGSKQVVPRRVGDPNASKHECATRNENLEGPGTGGGVWKIANRNRAVGACRRRTCRRARNPNDATNRTGEAEGMAVPGFPNGSNVHATRRKSSEERRRYHSTQHHRERSMDTRSFHRAENRTVQLRGRIPGLPQQGRPCAGGGDDARTKRTVGKTSVRSHRRCFASRLDSFSRSNRVRTLRSSLVRLARRTVLMHLGFPDGRAFHRVVPLFPSNADVPLLCRAYESLRTTCRSGGGTVRRSCFGRILGERPLPGLRFPLYEPKFLSLRKGRMEPG